jgi:hypothetical protein
MNKVIATGVIAGAMLVSSVPPAWSDRQWYVLDMSRVECVPAFASPGEYQQALRSRGIYKTTEVKRRKDGEIWQAVVYNNDDMGVMFLTSQADCEEMRKVGLDRGLLTNPRELR